MANTRNLPFTESDVIVTSVIVVFLLIMGLVVNTLLMTLLVKYRRLNSVFNLVVFSLCMTDIIAAVISWINLYRKTWGYNDFLLPNVFCVLFWVTHIWTSFSSSLHIVTFTILRFCAITMGASFRSIRTVHVKTWLCFVWVASLGGAVPMAFYRGVEDKNRSSDLIESHWPLCSKYASSLQEYKIYTQIAYSIFFYLPIIATIVLSVAISVILIKRRRAVSQTISTRGLTKRIRKENQAIAQLAVIVGVFLFGYFPFTAFEFYSIDHTGRSPDDIVIDWRFGIAQYICVRISDCLNPILYTGCSQRLKSDMRRLLKPVLPCIKTEAGMSFYKSERSSIDTEYQSSLHIKQRLRTQVQTDNA